MQLLTAPQLERFKTVFDIREYIKDPSLSLEYLKGIQHVVDMVSAMSNREYDEDDE